ncbi:DNA-processing protein DprA, partial [Candidatus Omnitrophota bacterium]
IPKIGSIRARRLLEAFGSAQAVFSASQSRLEKVRDINTVLARTIKNHHQSLDFKKELQLAQQYDVEIVTLHDKEYPDNLKNIEDAPLVLYVKGHLQKEDAVSVAIVGSRRSSYYGLSMAGKLAGQLAEIGITVVSGLARGIDSAAHRGALRSGGRTIAVLGSGLGCIYPPENKDLFEQITQSGVAISEFPITTPPFAYNFPRRNRIISGLSLGTVVIEAARNSGALITADCALEQGREVFALPGKADSATSFGTNRLIKQGAKLICGVEDIIEELQSYLKRHIEQRKRAACTRDVLQRSLCGSLDNDQKMLYNALSCEPKHIDIIMHETKLGIGKVSSLLVQLELKHLIKQMPGKLFIKDNG